MTTPDHLTRITSQGFTAYSDAVIFNQYQTGILFISMFGNKSSLKAISAAIHAGQQITIYAPGCSNGTLYDMSKDHSYRSIISHADPVTALDHVIFYPEAASYQHIDQTTRDLIFLFRAQVTQDERDRQLYLYLDKALSIPLHETWMPQLIQRMQAEGLIRDLPGYGPITGQQIALWSDKITLMITEMIRQGDRAAA